MPHYPYDYFDDYFFGTEIIVYVVNGITLAAGHLDIQHSILHGRSIPPSHVCVMVTTVKENTKAPCVLGDPEENSLIEKGKFYALPKASLYKESLREDGNVNLVPFLPQ